MSCHKNRSASACGSEPIHWMNHACVVTHHAANPVSVVVQAPATVIRRHKRPIQKTSPIIGAIMNQISSASMTVGTQNANATPPATMATDAARPTQT